MKSEFIGDRQAKVQLVQNLVGCFQGLEGIDDELVLISILDLILKRLVPQEAGAGESAKRIKDKQRKNEQLYKELKEWQDVMFEAKVPELMLDFIDTENDMFLCNRAL